MLKYKMPSWFYREKRVDYGICEVSVCPRTPPRGMLWRPFYYDDSLMYAAVGDISYVVESVVPGKSKRLAGESVGLKISDLTIAQYVGRTTGYPVTFLLAIKHLHGFNGMLYCHFTDMKQVQHYHALRICVLNVIPKAPSWKRHCGRTIIKAPEQRSMLKVGFYASIYNQDKYSSEIHWWAIHNY